ERGINAIIHYVPLHSAPAGVRFGRTAGPMSVTEDVAARLIRLPLHPQLTHEQQDHVVAEIERVLALAAALQLDAGGPRNIVSTKPTHLTVLCGPNRSERALANERP